MSTQAESPSSSTSRSRLSRSSHSAVSHAGFVTESSSPSTTGARASMVAFWAAYWTSSQAFQSACSSSLGTPVASSTTVSQDQRQRSALMAAMRL